MDFFKDNWISMVCGAVAGSITGAVSGWAMSPSEEKLKEIVAKATTPATPAAATPATPAAATPATPAAATPAR